MKRSYSQLKTYLMMTYQIKPKPYPSFAHTIQLVIKDRLANANQIKCVLGKASRLVNHVWHSTLALELFENVGHLRAVNTTQWNFQSTLLEYLLKVSNSSAMQQLPYNNKVNVHELNERHNRKLTPWSWQLIWHHAGQNIVTVSYILPVKYIQIIIIISITRGIHNHIYLQGHNRNHNYNYFYAEKCHFIVKIIMNLWSSPCLASPHRKKLCGGFFNLKFPFSQIFSDVKISLYTVYNMVLSSIHAVL